MLFKHLLLANRTFLELPDFPQETSLSPIFREHRDMFDLLHHVTNRFEIDMEVSLLGSSKWYGERGLYLVDLAKKAFDMLVKR